jgi:hypothetical protein
MDYLGNVKIKSNITISDLNIYNNSNIFNIYNIK